LAAAFVIAELHTGSALLGVGAVLAFVLGALLLFSVDIPRLPGEPIRQVSLWLIGILAGLFALVTVVVGGGRHQDAAAPVPPSGRALDRKDWLRYIGPRPKRYGAGRQRAVDRHRGRRDSHSRRRAGLGRWAGRTHTQGAQDAPIGRGGHDAHSIQDSPAVRARGGVPTRAVHRLARARPDRLDTHH